jgi:hypothetical protein
MIAEVQHWTIVMIVPVAMVSPFRTVRTIPFRTRGVVALWRPILMLIAEGLVGRAVTPRPLARRGFVMLRCLDRGLRGERGDLLRLTLRFAVLGDGLGTIAIAPTATALAVAATLGTTATACATAAALRLFGGFRRFVDHRCAGHLERRYLLAD